MKELTGRELDTSSLAALLRQAIGDMDERLATGEYEAHGGTWHRNAGDVKCLICLAGATFARFGVEPDTIIMYEEVPAVYRGPIGALDDLRRLGAWSAMRSMDMAEADPEVDATLSEALNELLCEHRGSYASACTYQDPETLTAWHSRDRGFYLKVADILEKHGL